MVPRIETLVRDVFASLTQKMSLVYLLFALILQGIFFKQESDQARVFLQHFLDQHSARLSQDLFLENALDIKGFVERNELLRGSAIQSFRLTNRLNETVIESKNANIENDFKKVFQVKVKKDLYFSDQLQGSLTLVKELDWLRVIARSLFSIFVICLFWTASRLVLRKVVRVLEQMVVTPLSALVDAMTHVGHEPEGADIEGILQNKSSAAFEVHALFFHFKTLMQKIRSYHLKSQETMQYQGRMKMAQQIAHDIRSPLTALRIAARGAHEMTPQRLQLLISAVDRIQSMSDDLLRTKEEFSKPPELFKYGIKSEKQHLHLLEHLQYGLSEVIEQKREEFPHMFIEFKNQLRDLKELPEFANAGFKSQDELVSMLGCLERVISNVINNAIEASYPSHRNIDVHCYLRGEQFVIDVVDYGKGLSPQVSTAAKSGEHNFHVSRGLGLPHAVQTLSQLGGVFHLIPKRMGTCAQIVLPLKASATEQLSLDAQFSK